MTRLDMSTSLNVVSSAAECCAETRRSAIFWRRGVIFLRVWRSRRRATGAARASLRRHGCGCRGRGGAGLSAAESMSPLVTRPALPVPATSAGLSPVSSAILRTAGDPGATGGWDAALGKGGAETLFSADAGAGAAAAAPTSMEATTWPIFTSAPASTLSVIVPAASAVPSDVILSVSSSKRGWSILHGVAVLLTCHLARMPLLIDSPIGGIFTSRGMVVRE